MKKKNDARKNYILDTNVLLHDPGSILNFAGNTVILPLVVLEELDNLKTREGLSGYQARQAVRELSEIVEKNPAQSMQEGVPLGNGITLRVEMNGYHTVPDGAEELDLRKTTTGFF